MILNNISIVNWGMGTAIIGVFVVVCVVLVAVVINMMKSDKKKGK
jgi:ABC-type spermidine/putrescine transport system permease subunit I